MPRLVATGLSISLDGYLAGPHQSQARPLGVGGERLHEWAFATRSMCALHGLPGGATGPDDDWARRAVGGVGATLMGRHMFGPVRGPWTEPAWRGWWGDDPPFHHPVFVLTHHRREPLEMDGGTTFHFITGGLDEALARAREAAGPLDVRVGGGAATIGQCLRAERLDELHVVVVPIVLGSGARLFDGGLEGLPDSYAVTRHQATDRVLHVQLERRGAR